MHDAGVLPAVWFDFIYPHNSIYSLLFLRYMLKLLGVYLTKNVCVKASVKFQRKSTLHLIKVGKLKRFKKVSSDLKTILKTDF